MKIIGWHLLRLAAEAEHDLVGMTVESIRRHAGRGRYLLILGSSRGKRYLVLGTRSHSAFFWAKKKTDIFEFEEYTPTESFNRLRGRKLTSVVIPRPDRLIELRWEKTGIDCPPSPLMLIVAWTGAAGNLWLVDPSDQRILEYGYRPKDRPDNPRVHDGPEGAVFVPPMAPTLVDWRTLSFPEYLPLRQQYRDLPVETFWHRHLWGIDTALAVRIAQRMTRPSPSETADDQTRTSIYWSEFEHLVRTLRIVTSPDGTICLPESDWNADHFFLDGDSETASPHSSWRSLAALLALCDLHAGRADDGTEFSAALRRATDTRLRELARQIDSLQQAIDRENEAQQWHHWGNLLNANRHMLKRGMTGVAVTDWETDTSVTIPLDPALLPQENIAACHERAGRLKRSAQRAQSRIDAVRREHDHWVSISATIADQSATAALMAQAAAELGLTRKAERSRKEAPPPRLPYREFLIGSDQVWVGRSSRDNDTLTLRHARPDDLFLHAQGCPGSHVILKRQRRGVDFDHQTIVAAAQIAAFFSRAKHAGLVPVAYADVRHVKKPRKAPPGAVRLEREQSIMVTPLPPPGYHDGGDASQ